MGFQLKGNHFSFPDNHKGICRGTKEPTYEDFAVFLEVLRSTGKINMLGAVPYIMHYMDVDYKTARKALNNWIEHPSKVNQLEGLIK
jgi:hypothetical protein